MTKATGPDNSDATIGAQLLDADPTITSTPAGEGETAAAGETAGGEVWESTEVLGDSAYGTGDLLDKIIKNGWKPTIKPHPLRPTVDGGFTLDDFAYDDQAGTLTCPEQRHSPAVEDQGRDLRQDLCRLPFHTAVHHLGPRSGGGADRA